MALGWHWQRNQILSLALMVGLAWLTATAPLLPLAILLGCTGGAVLLVRWPWLIWPALAFLLPIASGIKQGALSLSDLLLLLAAALWFADGVRRRTLTFTFLPWLGWLIAYLAVLYLSMLQAADLGEAALEMVKWAQLAIVVLLVRAMLPVQQRSWLVVALLLGGIGQALLGLYQFIYQIGPSWFIILGRFMRASGSFNQPNPYAGYLGLTLPVALSLALWAWRQVWLKHERRLRSTLWAIFYSSAALLMAAGLGASWSRGGWLGALAGVAVVLFARSRVAMFTGALLTLALLTAILLGAFSPALAPPALSERLQEVPAYVGLGDLLNQPLTDENFSIVERLAHWVAAIRMWERSPWLGVGPGNYAVVYPEVRLLAWDDALGHAHNVYLNALAETGLIGLAFFLAFWLAVITWSVRQLRAAQEDANRWQAALAVGVLGVLAHLSVHNFFDNLFVQGMPLQIALWLSVLDNPATRPKLTNNRNSILNPESRIPYP